MLVNLLIVVALIDPAIKPDIFAYARPSLGTHVVSMLNASIPGEEPRVQKDYRKDYRLYHTAMQGFVGLTLYSWLVPTALNLEDKTAAVTGLWTPVFWAGGQYIMAKASGRVRLSQVLMAGAGAYNGLAHGSMFAPTSEYDDRPKATWGLTFSLMENIGNFYLARATNPTPGVTIRFILQGLNGYAQGAALADIVNSRDGNNVMAMHSIISGYGSYFGSLAVQDTWTTAGDAIFEYVSSNVLGTSLFLLFSSEKDYNPRAAATSFLIGNYAGYAAGLVLSHERDISLGGALVTLVAPCLLNGLILGTLILTDASPETSMHVMGVLLPVTVYGMYYILSNKTEIGTGGES